MGSSFYKLVIASAARQSPHGILLMRLPRRLRLLAMTWVVLGFAFPASAAPVKVVEANGVKAWVVEDHLLPIVSIELAFKRAGNAYDPVEKQGLAYEVASMLNEGAGEHSSNQYQKLLEENAIEFEPDVDRDNFYVTVKTLSENLNLATGLVNDALTQPKFAADDFARVKGQTDTEIKKNLESAGYVGSLAFYKEMFPGHPYSQVKEGDFASLEKISPEDLHQFAHAHFAKDNLVIAIVGDVDEEKAKTILESVTKDLAEKSVSGSLPLPAAFPKSFDH